MFDTSLRGFKERITTPVARIIGRRIHPTAITVAAAPVGLAAAVAAGAGAYGIALTLWLCNRALDGIDGTVARLTGAQSDLGGYLDLLLDVVVYSAVPIALALQRGERGLLLVVTVLLALYYVNITSWLYLSALIEKRKHPLPDNGTLTSIAMPAGLVEGSETLVVYSLALLPPQHAVLLFAVMGGAIAVGIAQRIRWAMRNL